jgi:hypothetical protein
MKVTPRSGNRGFFLKRNSCTKSGQKAWSKSKAALDEKTDKHHYSATMFTVPVTVAHPKPEEQRRKKE